MKLKKTHRVELICKASLIIWDEAPVTHRYIFGAVDRTFCDVRQAQNPHAASLPFGGVTMVLGQDFWQVLLVVPKEGREDTVAAAIFKSYLGQECKVYTLIENIRVEEDVAPILVDGKLTNLKDLILKVGNGLQQTYEFGEAIDSSSFQILKEV